MTIVVPRSGSLNTSAITGRTMSRNGTVPPRKPPDPRAALRQPVGEVDDERELGDLGGVDGRQRPELQPARRTADDDVEARARSTSTSRTARRRRTGPTRAAGSGSRRASSRPSRAARAPPTGSAGRRWRTCRCATGSRLHRRRRIDHQDAERGEADDRRRGSSSRARDVRAGACRARALRRRRRAARRPGCASLAGAVRPGRGMGGARFIGLLLCVSGRDQVGHGLLEGPAPGRVVHEHVEARGGRAHQHGRRRRPRRREARVTGIASARRTASSRVSARSTCASPASRNSRLEPGPLSPISTAATARSATTAGEAVRSRPCPAAGDQHERRRRTLRSAAITASGCVPCESFTKRTPSTRRPARGGARRR